MSDTPRTNDAWKYIKIEAGTLEHDQYCTSRDLERENANLRERAEVAEKDAARYRWLRNQDSESHIRVFIDEGGRQIQRCFDDVDNAIDAALKEKE